MQSEVTKLCVLDTEATATVVDMATVPHSF
jgi:hypothetical protein